MLSYRNVKEMVVLVLEAINKISCCEEQLKAYGKGLL